MGEQKFGKYAKANKYDKYNFAMSANIGLANSYNDLPNAPVIPLPKISHVK